MRRALCGTRQVSWLWQNAVVRALKALDFVHLVVVPCTYFHEAWDMALTYHGDDFRVPGYAGRGTCSTRRRELSGSYRARIPGRGPILEEVCVVDGFRWHGDPVKVGQFISLMGSAGSRSLAVLCTKARGHGRPDADRELEGSVMELAMDQPDLQFSLKTVMSTIAKPLEITQSRLRQIARYLEDKPVLEHVYAENSQKTH